ncbi:50S ribosomal protein L11 methyltransferase [Pendulispora albinea]|uniref:50S ribosomal protein L11 methyltransferase n=1 Tax=Pendulispora albinea TaxID=2741071 RepID=A0ABZ2LLH6_9BACT
MDSEQSSAFLALLRTQVDALKETFSAVDTLLDAGTVSESAVHQASLKSIPRWHFAMVNDHARNDAFAAAFKQLVRRGMHVLDIGTGTGLLAMLAVKAGARRVTTCEANPLMADIAKRIIAANGMASTITVVSKKSTDLRMGSDLPEPVDLIVSEIVDCGLVGEGLLPTLRHAREHLLKPGGILVPRRARLIGALVESPAVMRLNNVEYAAGFDVRWLNIVATRGHFPVRLGTWPYRFLSDPVVLASFDLVHGGLTDGEVEVTVPITASGQAHMVAAWFELDLCPGVVLSNRLEDTESHWMQACIPFPAPVAVRENHDTRLAVQWRRERLSVHTSPEPHLTEDVHEPYAPTL